MAATAPTANDYPHPFKVGRQDYIAVTLCDAAAALAPRPVRMDGLVDGLDREVPADALEKTFETARQAYRALKAESRFQLGQNEADLAPAR